MATEVIVINDKFPHRHVQLQGLTEDGLGVNNNVNGNYSVTPKTFSYTPPVGDIFYVSRIVVYVEDTGTFDTGAYGNAVVMTNGYHVWHTHDEHTHIIIPDTNAIKTTGDMASNMFKLNHESFGAGNEFIAAPFSFEEVGGPIVLNGNTGDTFNAEFRDNLTGLVRHNFTLQGYVLHSGHY